MLSQDFAVFKRFVPYGLLKKFGFSALVSGFIKVATIPLSAVTFAGHK